MKKVLVLTYYWPPAGGPGVQRWLKFVKYLMEMDWEPTIITPKDGSYPSYDSSLEKEIPVAVKVHKTATKDPFKLYNLLQGKNTKQMKVSLGNSGESSSVFHKFAKYVRANYYLPDARVGWNKYALSKATEVLNAEKMDAMITTGPPHSTHLVGMKLKNKFNIPWLADFRDPWVDIYYNSLLPRSRKTIEKDKQLEQMVLDSADAITVVSPGLRNQLSLTKDLRTHVIYNGFDHTEFGLELKPDYTKFTIAYTGNFKANQDCLALWKAIKDLVDENAAFEKSLMIRLIGNVAKEVHITLDKVGLKSYVSIEPYKDHSEIINVMHEVSALLFIVPKAKNNELIITGKIFEYLASGNNLICIGPPKGNANKIIKTCSDSTMHEYKEVTLIKESINNIFHNWTNKIKEQHKSDTVNQFSRYNQAAALAKTLNSICTNEK